MTRLITLISALVFSASLTAQQIMEIIPLNHRLVNDVLPTLQQLVSPGGTVTGMNNQLIIRTDPDNLADLKNVLSALDTRLRQLRITVRQDIEADSEINEHELSARVRAGEFRGQVGHPDGGPGVRLGVGDADNNIQYRNYNSRRQDSDAHSHFVTTIEGQPAFITAGQVVPLPNQGVVYGPYGAVISNSVQYRNVGAGFYVTPRVVGNDGVNLEVSPHAEQLDSDGGGVINSRGLSTTVSGRLGEWIPLGGAQQSEARGDDGIAYSTRRSGHDAYDVWVKVEVVP